MTEKQMACEYVGALMKLVKAMGMWTGTREDFLSSFLTDQGERTSVINRIIEERESRASAATPFEHGEGGFDVPSEGGLNEGRKEGGEGRDAMSPNFSRKSISVYASDNFQQQSKWSKFHSVSLTPREMVSWSSVGPRAPLNNLR